MDENNNIEQELRKIKQEILDCRKCSLYKTRIYPVIGEGNHQAKIMFVGEAPGANESRTGRPFCGAAGRILDELLESAGIKRKDVYITNVLKDRPPNNRNPKPEEIIACSPFLERQIEIIKPAIIGCLGNFATAFMLKKYELKDCIQGISKIHGQVFESETLFRKIKIIPFYHPAVATYNINMKPILEKDFSILGNFKD